MNRFLYKFRTFDNDGYNLDNLRNDCIYASNIAQLNDPFEGLIDNSRMTIELSVLKRFGIDKQAEVLKIGLDDFLELRKKTGIYSMSQDWQSELLWAHYADSHKGFCIEYDIEYLTRFYYQRSFFIKVEYVDSPVNISVLKMFKKKLEPIEIVRLMNGIKSLPWSYEKEYRIVFDECGAKDIDKRGLKSVTLGANISDDNKLKILDILSKKTVKVYQAKLADNSYIIDRELIHEFKEELVEKENFEDIDPFYLSEDYLEENFSKKGLVEKALNIVRAEPYVKKINHFALVNEKGKEIVSIWAEVERDWRPQVRFVFEEELLSKIK